MEDPHFIKCEPEWQSETENSSNLERNVRLPSDKLVQVKVEPDLLFPGRSLEQEDGKVFKEECGIQEVKSEESSTSGAGTNKVMQLYQGTPGAADGAPSWRKTVWDSGRMCGVTCVVHYWAMTPPTLLIMYSKGVRSQSTPFVFTKPSWWDAVV